MKTRTRRRRKALSLTLPSEPYLQEQMYELIVQFTPHKRLLKRWLPVFQKTSGLSPEHLVKMPAELKVLQDFDNEIGSLIKMIEEAVNPLLDSEADVDDGTLPEAVTMVWTVDEEPDEDAVEAVLKAAIAGKVGSFSMEVAPYDDEEDEEDGDDEDDVLRALAHRNGSKPGSN